MIRPVRNIHQHRLIPMKLRASCGYFLVFALWSIICQTSAFGIDYAIRPIVMAGEHLTGMDEGLFVGGAGGSMTGGFPATFAPNGDIISPVSLVEAAEPSPYVGYGVWRFPSNGEPLPYSLPVVDWGVAARAVDSQTTYVQTEYPVGGRSRERLFAFDGDTPTEIANTIDPLPGVSLPINYLSQIRANDSVLAFGGQLATQGVPTKHGVWTRRNGVVAPVAITGQAAPGFPTNAPFDEVILNGVFHDGDVLFFAEVTYSGDRSRDWGIYRSNGVAIQPLLVGRQATPQPELTFGVSYLNASNGRGDFVFASRLLGPGADYTNEETIWSYRDGEMRMLARESYQPLGTEPRTVYRDFYEVSINDAGTIAFRAETYHPTFGVRSTIFHSVGEDDPAALLQVGDLIEGSRVTRIYEPRLAANGDVAFEVGLANGSFTARGVVLYSQVARSLALIREGDALLLAPGDERTIDDIRLNGFDVMGERTPAPDGSALLNVRFTDSTSGLFLSQPVFVPGDLNFDGAVNTGDVAAFASQFGRELGDLPHAADLNSDGSVNLYDLVMLRSHLTPAVQSATAVPEPSAAIFVLAAAAGLLGAWFWSGRRTGSEVRQVRQARGA